MISSESLHLQSASFQYGYGVNEFILLGKSLSKNLSLAFLPKNSSYMRLSSYERPSFYC